MKIGRRVYFQKTDGQVILEVGEREGNVVRLTTKEECEIYGILPLYEDGFIDMVELKFGEDTDKFFLYSYKVDSETKKIVWNLEQLLRNYKIRKTTLLERFEDTSKTINVLGQQLAEKDIQLIEVEADRDTLGQRLVDLELRLMMGGL